MSLDRLGHLEHLVLLAIARLGRDSYGVSIIDELQTHAGRPILRPSVYLSLRRLESRALIRSFLGEPEARRGGRARRHFEITAAGRAALRDSQRLLTTLYKGVDLSAKGR